MEFPPFMRPLDIDDLPPMRENPFNGRPLERGEHRLLGGRDELVFRLTSLIGQRSPRMILLKGERGSGRTSLIHALASQTELHRSFTMFPHENHAMRLLDETFSMLVGFDRPPHVTAMVDHMVEAVSSYHGPLQLISYDFPSASGPMLCSSMQRLTGALRRLKALVLVTVTPEQFQAFPEDLVNEFDSVMNLEPVDEDGIRDIIEKRIASVSRKSWHCSDEFVEGLYDETQGHLSRLVRRMRDIVDKARANSSIREQELGWQRETGEEDSNAHSTMTKMEPQEDSSVETESQPHDSESDIDSNPWGLDEEESLTQELTPEITSFTLEPEEDEPEPIVQSRASRFDAPVTGGMFGSLARRNRESMYDSPPFDPRHDSEVPQEQQSEPMVQDEAIELWLEEDAPLMQSVSSPSGQQEIVPPSPSQQIPTTGISSVAPPLAPSALPNPHESPESGINTHLPTGSPYSGLANRLAGLAPQPQRWNNQSISLDIERLRRLSAHEREIMEVASQREFSPSDDFLRSRLDVKRPRMSQLANGLYKAGILAVRQHGRSRWFSLTNDARAQLIAWGMLGELK